MPPSDEATYQEPWRPQFHYSPPDLFVNDPNGLVHHDGEYHLFYQYRLDAGLDIVWGHAVSTDLLHWENLPVAIPRGADDKSIFSGSVVIDEDDTSGFGEPGNPAMVAIYTAFEEGNQSQALAYSLDRGRTFTKYEGNPVLDLGLGEFRDPKVFWHGATDRWVMVVAMPDDHQVAVYGSPDLRHWQLLSKWGPLPPVGGQYEVPDLFPLRVDGDPARTKWVMIISTNPGGLWGGSLSAAYIGDFDGTAFREDARYAYDGPPAALPGAERTPWLDWGKDNYAGMTFENLPDDRRLFVGWLNNWEYAQSNLVPTIRWWRGQHSVPRELALVTIDGRPELVQQPLRELGQLHAGEPHHEAAHTLTGVRTLGATGRQLDIRLRLRPGTASRAGVKVLTGANGDETVVGFDAAAGHAFIDRTRSGTAGDVLPGFAGVHSAPLRVRGGELDLRILVDHSIVEVFANRGERVLTDLVYPATDSDGIALFAEGGTAEVQELVVHQMRSIWNLTGAVSGWRARAAT
jgi:sucrose-6-phosphate hydrolase SacC (GH32 family)